MSPNATRLFDRRCTLQVGTLLIEAGQGTGLDVAFTVKRGTKASAGASKPQPNTCDLQIWNLSPTHRKELEASTVPTPGTKVVPVVLSAGYAGRSTVIYSGELRAASTKRSGAEVVTELSTGDGDHALTQTRLVLGLGPGAAAADALKAILAALGVGEGNLKKGLALLKAQPLASQLFAKGAVLKGAAADLMTDFCRSADLDWSVQNGLLQLTARGQPLDGDAILIDEDHGMLGSPSVDTKGILAVDTLMLPDVFPGTRLAMNAADVKGGYRVISVETKGDTAGSDWGHAIEGKRY